MKIRPTSPATTAESTLGQLGQTGVSRAETGPAAALPADIRQQVELVANNQIKQLLDSLTASLGEYRRLEQKLPPAVAGMANEIGDAFLGPQALADGMTTLLKGVRSGGEQLTALAQKLTDAAVLQEAFPTGLPPSLASALEAFIGNIAGDDDFAANMLIITRQFSGTQAPDPAVAAGLREFLAQTLPQLPTPEAGREFAQAAKVLEQFIPERVIQATVTHNMPEVKDALVWQKIADTLPWMKLSSDSLKEAAQTLREMTPVVPEAGRPSAETGQGQKVLSMAVPLFLGEGKPYPAYIHISQDEEEAGPFAGQARDTWMRISLATENIGLVDMVFHLHNFSQLSIRLNFSDAEAASEFNLVLPDLRQQLTESPLILTDLLAAVSQQPVKP